MAEADRTGQGGWLPHHKEKKVEGLEEERMMVKRGQIDRSV